MNVLNITDQLSLVDDNPLNPQILALNAQDAAAAFIAAGTAANTVLGYRSALVYWSAWLQLRYGQALGDAPLPPGIDATLIAARVKAKWGPLAFNTLSHRLVVLAKWH